MTMRDIIAAGFNTSPPCLHDNLATFQKDTLNNQMGQHIEMISLEGLVQAHSQLFARTLMG